MATPWPSGEGVGIENQCASHAEVRIRLVSFVNPFCYKRYGICVRTINRQSIYYVVFEQDVMFTRGGYQEHVGAKSRLTRLD